MVHVFEVTLILTYLKFILQSFIFIENMSIILQMFIGERICFGFNKKNQKRIREILKNEVGKMTGQVRRWDIPLGEYEAGKTTEIPRTSPQAQNLLKQIIPPDDR
jgi:hypothetical protein